MTGYDGSGIVPPYITARLTAPALTDVQHKIRETLRETTRVIRGGTETDFLRGVRLGLRTAYLHAGGHCDGTAEGWARIEASDAPAERLSPDPKPPQTPDAAQ